jgi:YHS domain-containing protein
MAIDPVCGMEVNEARAEYESTYKGIKYYFCSAVCKEEFDRDPESYMMMSDFDEVDDFFDPDD